MIQVTTLGLWYSVLRWWPERAITAYVATMRAVRQAREDDGLAAAVPAPGWRRHGAQVPEAAKMVGLSGGIQQLAAMAKDEGIERIVDRLPRVVATEREEWEAAASLPKGAKPMVVAC